MSDEIVNLGGCACGNSGLGDAICECFEAALEDLEVTVTNTCDNPVGVEVCNWDDFPAITVDEINIEELDVTASGMASFRRCTVDCEPIDIFVCKDENHAGGQGQDTDTGVLSLEVVGWAGPDGTFVPGAPTAELVPCDQCVGAQLDTVCLLAPVAPFTIDNGVSADCDINNGDFVAGDEWTFTFEPSSTVDGGYFCYPGATETGGVFSITGTLVGEPDALVVDWPVIGVSGPDGLATLPGHYVLDGVCYPLDAVLCSGGNESVTITDHVAPTFVDKVHGPGIEATYTDCATGEPIPEAAEWAACPPGGIPEADCCPEPETCDCGSPQCVKWSSVVVQLDNTGTSFAEAIDFEITNTDGTVVEFTVGPVGGWSEQVEAIAAAMDAAYGGTYDPRCTFLPDGCGGLLPPPSDAPAQPGIFARYINGVHCPTDLTIPVSATAVRESGRVVKLPLYIIETPEKRGWVCPVCTEGAPVLLDENMQPVPAADLPVCVFDCAETIPPIPLSTCEFELTQGCDNVGQGDLTEFVTVTRQAAICDGQIEISYFVEEDGALVDYTLVGDFVDCATGQIIQEPVPVPECADWEIVDGWRLVDFTPGVNTEFWDVDGNAAPMAAAADPASTIFTGAVDYSGMPAHINGPPDRTVIEPFFRALTTNGQDQSRTWGYVVISEPTRFVEMSGSAESHDVFVGECCTDPTYQGTNEYPAPAASPYEIGVLEPGIHYIGFETTDWSVWSTVSLRGSTDLDGDPAGFPVFRDLSATKPRYEKCPVKYCPETGLFADPVTGDLLTVDLDVFLCEPQLCGAEPADPFAAYATECETCGGAGFEYVRAAGDDTEQSFGIGDVIGDGTGGIKFDTATADISPELQAAHQAIIDCINSGGVANTVITDQDGNTAELDLDVVGGDGNPQYFYGGTVIDGEPAGGKVRAMTVTCSTGSCKALRTSGCNDDRRDALLDQLVEALVCEHLCATSTIGERVLFQGTDFTLGGVTGATWDDFVTAFTNSGGSIDLATIYNDQGQEISDVKQITVCVDPASANGPSPLSWSTFLPGEIVLEYLPGVGACCTLCEQAAADAAEDGVECVMTTEVTVAELDADGCATLPAGARYTIFFDQDGMTFDDAPIPCGTLLNVPDCCGCVSDTAHEVCVPEGGTPPTIIKEVKTAIVKGTVKELQIKEAVKAVRTLAPVKGER